MKKITLSLYMLLCVALGYSQQEASSSRTAPKQTTATAVRSNRPVTKDPNAASVARKEGATPATNSNTATPVREAVEDKNAATNQRTAPKQ